MVRKAPGRGIEAARFELTDDLRRELQDKFPRVDLDKTFEVFKDKALANGWLYTGWPAAFRNYIRNGSKYGGVEYRGALVDPAFEHLITKAKSIGFRMPYSKESAGVYRTALDIFDKLQAKQASEQPRLNLGNAIKRIDK